MSFSPGQIITAQRLNRLQTKNYFSLSSGAITSAGSGNVAGTAISITNETDGAGFAVTFSAAVYATGAMAANCNTFAKYDLASSSTFALGQWATNGEKGTVANVWSGTIATAGTYTWQLGYTVVANGQLSIYTALMVQIMEVA